MRFILCIIFIFLSACGPQPNKEPTQVEYKITLKHPGFLVEIKHNAAGQTAQFVPYSKAYSSLQNLPATKEYPIRYIVTPKSREPIMEDTVVDLGNGYFQTVGHGLFACIGQVPEQKKSVKITWNAPGNWRFANSFSALQTEQNFEATCRELRSALYVGGKNLTIRETWFGALALLGEFTPGLEDALKRNMKRVQQFWDSSEEPYHFVSIRNSKSEENEGGTAQFKSFQLVLKTTTQGFTLDHLITHEYFHNWNGLKIKQAPTEDLLAHLDIWWFVEGFTDYYAYWLVLKDNPTRYAKSFVEPKSSLNNMPLFLLKSLSNKRNWTSDPQEHLQQSTIFHIPYIYGRRLAAKLDQAIHNYSGKRLKNVMHDIIKRSENPLFYLTQESILTTLCGGNYLDCNMANLMIQNYVINGWSLPPPVSPLI